MGSLSDCLRASVKFEAYDGDSSERGICAQQMLQAATEIDRLEKANRGLMEGYDKLAHKCGKCGKPCPYCDVARLREVLAALIARIEKGSNYCSELQQAKDSL